MTLLTPCICEINRYELMIFSWELCFDAYYWVEQVPSCSSVYYCITNTETMHHTAHERKSRFHSENRDARCADEKKKISHWKFLPCLPGTPSHDSTQFSQSARVVFYVIGAKCQGSFLCHRKLTHLWIGSRILLNTNSNFQGYLTSAPPSGIHCLYECQIGVLNLDLLRPG